jgi:replicative DNA helicase
MNPSTNNGLPASPDDERRLLSCVFIDGADTFARAQNAGVTGATFHDPRNRTIYSAMQALQASGAVIGLDTVASQVQALGQLEAMGGWAHLIASSNAEATTAYADQYITRIRNLEVLRGVITESTALISACHGLQAEAPSTVIDPAITRLLSIAAGLGTTQEQPWDSVVGQAGAMLEEIIKAGGVPEKQSIRWPWPRMDERFNPMQRSQLIVIAARPSVGKSSLARPIALAAAIRRHSVYFVTLEVNPERVPLQMAAALSKIGLREVNKAHVKDQDDMRRALQSLHGLGITISKRDRNIARICGRARALKAQGKLDLLIVDHGLLLEDVANARSSELISAISTVTKALKTLATELEIVVILLWQLNRNSVADDNREPHLSDLRGSGSLEEDADKVLLLHRPNEDPLTHQPQLPTMTTEFRPRFFTNIIQAKGRDDGTSLMSFYFDRRTARFNDIQDEKTT